MNPDVRRAEPADLGGVQRLNHELFRSDARSDDTLDVDWPYSVEGENYFRAMISGQIGACFVADAGGDVVGYVAGALRRASGCYTVRRAEIENMIVAAPHRRTGLGSRLVSAFTQWCVERGAARLDVTAFAPNTGAIAFYEANGFAPHEVGLSMRVPVR